MKKQNSFYVTNPVEFDRIDENSTAVDRIAIPNCPLISLISLKIKVH